MLLGWWRRRRRRRFLATPAAPDWEASVEALPVLDHLDESECERIVAIARILDHEKNWEGCGGFDLTDGARRAIALQAALLLLGREHDYYPHVQSILVYPSSFRVPHRYTNEIGLVTEGAVLDGEAWQQGAVVLSWDAALLGARDGSDGTNVVLHEFAHQLDFEAGGALGADGAPALARGTSRRFATVMVDAYAAHVRRTDAGREGVLDPYGAQNEAEFFAVATEAFFEMPRELRDEQADVYDVLRDCYGQDPAARLAPD